MRRVLKFGNMYFEMMDSQKQIIKIDFYYVKFYRYFTEI